MKRTSAFFFLGIIFLASISAADAPLIRCERYSIEQGLSQSIVACIIQDQRGFMWFGTEDGLNRFDGYAFQVIRTIPGDPRSLSHSNVTALLQDRAGFIWIGTFSGGLNRYDPRTGDIERFRHVDSDPGSLSHNGIRCLFEDRQGAIWVGTEGGGLNRLETNGMRFTAYRHDEANSATLVNDSIYALLEDRAGGLWVGTSGGLCLLDRARGTFTSYRHAAGDPGTLSSDDVRALAEDPDGSLWIGTFGGGLNRRERTHGTFTPYRYDSKDSSSLGSDQIYGLLVDRRGRLWIGTNGGGLNLLDRQTGSFVRYTQDPNDPYSLSYNEVFSIFEDRGGMIWVGTYGGGISKFNGNPKPFALFRSVPGRDQGLSHNIVWAFLEDAGRNLWIGTHGGGLDRYDRASGRWTHFRHRPGDPSSLSNDRVRVILQDRSGVFWIGTNGGGLNRFDPGRGVFRTYRHDPGDPSSLSHDQIRALLQDRYGKLWVGTHGGGLNEFDPATGRFTRFQFDPRDPSSLGGDVIRVIHEDRQGRLWIGSDGGGLNLYDRANRRFIRDTAISGNSPGLLSRSVFTIFEDGAGIFWLGTWGAGLARFDPTAGAFRHFSIADGLPSNSIYGILQDGRGCLWMSTPSGLSRYDPATRQFKNYSEWDGLQSREFNGGAFYKSPSGEMFFGGIGGFNAFFPEAIQDNPHIPPVVVTAFRKLNRDIPLEVALSKQDRLDLWHQDYFFSFEFAALDFTVSQKNRYAYKMEGVDPDWIMTGAGRRVATYTKLSPGHYTFRVKGSNNDGVWNEAGIAVSIVIHPAYWQTLWFRALILLMLAAFAYYLSRRHVENVRLKTELRAAHEAQMSIMPRRDPELPGLQVSSACIPASETGGDFFDYLWLDRENLRFGIVVADVSGKAMKAAMTALLTSGMIYSKVDEIHSVHEIVTSLNRSLYQKTDRNMFTALCLAGIDLRSRELSFVNAGLSELVVKRGGRAEVMPSEGPRFPLGVSRDQVYQERKRSLEVGDVVVFVTDGITDSQNREGEFFGMNGLVRVLEELDTQRLSAVEIKEGIIRKVRKFSRGTPPEDDITLVVVKVVE